LIKIWLLRILGSILLLVTGLIFTAPAKLMVRLIPENAGLNLQGVSGRFLSGEVLHVYYAGKSLQQLAWDVSLPSLITGKLGSTISINDPAFNGELFLEKGFSNTLSISDVNASQMVTALIEYYRPLKLLYPEGTLDWTDVSLSMDDKTVHQASGNIKWKDATLLVNNNLLTLGTINIEVSDEDGDLLLTITDQNSQLDVRGKLRLGVDKRYHLLLNLSDELPSNIKNVVLMVARPDGKGRLRMNTKGRL